MSGRNSQLSRVFTLLTLLEGNPQGLTASEAWARLKERGHDASKRTLYRDLQLLQQAGFPLTEEGDDGNELSVRWKLQRTARINQYLALSVRELVGLHLAQGTLKPLRDTPFYEDVTSAFRKIEEKLGAKAVDYIRELAKDLQFEPGPKWGLGVKPDVLDTIHHACNEEHVLHMTYDSAHSGQNRERRVGPHYIYLAKGSIYLVAEDLEDRKTKVFSIPRISEARMSEEPYHGERSDPEKFFNSAIGVYHSPEAPEEIVVRISPKLARYASERSWHPSQRTVQRSDGSLDLRLEVAITPELIQWLMGFGAEAKVIRPERLVEQVEDEAQRLLAQYRKRVA